MSGSESEPRTARVKSAGVAAWRTAVLAAATLLVVVLFVGMGYLVYVDEMSEGPLVLFTGVILGYLLRYVHSVV